MRDKSAQNLLDFSARLREFIQRAIPAQDIGRNAFHNGDFSALAMTLFELQFTRNAVYRRFCESRKAVPGRIGDWREIPAMPTAAFKELELTSLSPEKLVKVFHSSGTTEHRPSRHFHSEESLAIYEASLLPWFERHFCATEFSRAKNRLIVLTPTSQDAPHSSLVHMFETIRRRAGFEKCLFCGRIDGEGAWQLDLDKSLSALRECIENECAVTLCGTAFNFVHLLDHLSATGTRLKLARGSCVLETGGYKGRSRTLLKSELHNLIADSLGVLPQNIVSEYGMSEMSSQAYDGVRGSVLAGPRVFHFPPWARTEIISPETGRAAREGETGLIRIFDLANVYSVMAIQTEDLGVRHGDGFELLGRAAMAEVRGCSLASV